jgi:hypothetical protein
MVDVDANYFGVAEHVVWFKHDIFFGTQMP